MYIQVRGIKALEYRPEPNVFNMSYPNNFCYCPGFLECAGTDGDAYDNKPCRQCLDGMIRVSSCYGGVPVVMTAPHFFRGDLSLISAVDGMNPDPELHDTVLYIEPLSGVAMRAHKRIQVSTRTSRRFPTFSVEETKPLNFHCRSIWMRRTARM